MPRHLVTCVLSASGAAPLDELAGSLLPADAYCRFLRARGEEVLFVCASGEHGTAAELAATGAGLDPAAHRAQLHDERLRLASRLGLSFDALGRGSSRLSAEQTQYFARRLEQEGHLDVRQGSHLFLCCAQLAADLRAWFESAVGGLAPAGADRFGWPGEGPGDCCITQDLPWGVPVDRTGFEGVVYREWFGTPIVYIGATREWADAGGEPLAWRRWWRASDEVELVQFITRADLPAHTVCFPCALIGSGEAWKLADTVKVFDRLSYYGSGSRGDEAAAFIAGATTPAAADCLRYQLLASAPEAAAEDFSWEALGVTVNADLAGTLARCAGRSFDFAQRCFGLTLPAGGAPGPEEEWLVARAVASIEAITARLAALEFRRAVAELRAAWSLAGEYLDRKRPWERLEADRDDAALSARVCLNLLALLARLSAPVLPFSAERLLDALAVPAEGRRWPARFELDALAAGHKFDSLPSLFGPVTEAEVERWRHCSAGPDAALLALGRR